MTMQSSDRLLWKDQTHIIVSSLNPKAIYSEVEKVEFQFMETSCWRGYEATWVIGDDNYLRLKNIEGVINGLPNNNNIGEYEYEPAEQIYSIFPTHDSPVAALSYTGEFTVGSGERHRERQYLVTYAIYHIISLIEGKVVNVEERDRDSWLKDMGLDSKDKS